MSRRDYPDWSYYPATRRPDPWAEELLDLVASVRPRIDSAAGAEAASSDAVLGVLRPGLLERGYSVEVSKTRGDRVRRPVLFGPQGVERVSYEVDAMHDELGIVLEIEAGRGATSNALYRDIIRASLIVEARFFALGMMTRYRYRSGESITEAASYEAARTQLDAIYASGRIRLPFEGVLLFGY